MTTDIIIERLRLLEAQAAGLLEECYKTRMLIEEGDVSTSPEDQPVIPFAKMQKIRERRRKQFLGY